MTQTVVGLFDKSSDAQDAVQQLISNGFTDANVDVSLSNNSNSGNTSGMGNSGYTGDTANTDFKLDNDEHESGIAKFFKNLFGDNDDADRFNKVASRGSSIVTVYAQSAEEAKKAANILDENGAVDVDEKSNEYGYGTSGAAPVGMFNETTGMSATDMDSTTTGRNYDTTNNTTDANKSIPIIEENLEVGKRTVQTGGMRLKSRIVERPVEEELRLRKERVYVDRNTVNRPATEADFTTFKEGTVEVTEHAEVPVVSKQARVVEEVSLGKEVNERNETVRDTVRSTEVDVEDITGKSGSSATDTTWTKDNN